MFTYVKLNNYRSLNNVIFDLKETKEKTKKLVAVYGENGCGKSNLIRSFSFLFKLMHSFDIEKNEIEITKIINEHKETDLRSLLMDMLKKNSLSTIYEESRTIDCEDNTRVEFGFEVDNHEGNYVVEFNDKIVYERLYYYTGKQSGVLYEITDDSMRDPKLSNLIFKSSKIRNELKESIQKYWGRHSLLSITYDLSKKTNKEYISDNISDYFFCLHKAIEETSITLKESQFETTLGSCNDINCVSDLKKGEIPAKNLWLLKNTEKMINDFFTQTYSDVKKVSFNTEKNGENIKYRLVLYKNINNKIRLVPIEQESTGTMQILNVLKSLFGVFCGRTVIIDEVDNGVHDLLLKVVIDSMKEHITGQLIITTHNTSLLESFDPKMVYIINSKYDGTKEMICLSEYKIQDHNSPRIRYMKGMYGGVPLVDYVDYVEIINNLKEKRPDV